MYSKPVHELLYIYNAQKNGDLKNLRFKTEIFLDYFWKALIRS